MKTVLVTGGAGGIGEAVCRFFAQNGYAVAIHYHKGEEKALALQKQLAEEGCAAGAFKADLSVPGAAAELAFRVQEALGRIEVLVNNAGVSKTGLLQELSQEEWQVLLNVNLSAPLLLCKAVLPGMIQRQRGCILNISSVWGVRGASCEVAYSATKAGLIGLTKALAKEVGPSGVRVNCIAPGVIDTPMNAPLGAQALEALAEETPLGRLGSPADVAALALFLASEEASFVTGQVICADGGFAL